MGFVARQSAHTFLTSVVSKFGIGLLIDVFISRSLGADGKGQYFQFVTTLTGLCAVFGFGLQNANLLLGAKHTLSHPKLIRLSMLAALASTAVAVLVLLTGYNTDWIEYLLPNRRFNTGTVLLFAVLPFVFLNYFFIGIVLAKQDVIFNNYVSLASLGTVCAALAVFFLTGTLTPLVAVGSYTVSLLISLGMIGYRYRADIRLSLRASLSADDARILLGQTGIIYLAIMIHFLNLRIDAYMIRYYLDDASLGIYATAIRMAESVWLVSDSVGASLLPTVAAGNPNAVRASAKLAVIVLLTSIALAVAVFLIGKYALVLLYSDRFAAAALPLVWLLPGVIAFSAVRVLSAYLTGAGHLRLHTLLIFITFLFTVTLDLLLVPKYGILGAAAASSLTYTLYLCLMLFAFGRTTGLRLGDVPALVSELKNDVFISARKLRERFGV